MWNFAQTFPLAIFHEIRWQKSCDIITSTVFHIQKFEKTDKKTVTQEWKMIGLAVLYEIMKMYGGAFLYSNPLGSYEQFEFRDEPRKLRLGDHSAKTVFVYCDSLKG